jgi:hypothetical protein
MTDESYVNYNMDTKDTDHRGTEHRHNRLVIQQRGKMSRKGRLSSKSQEEQTMWTQLEIKRECKPKKALQEKENYALGGRR